MKNMCSSNEFKDSLGEGPWISMDFGLFVGLLCHWCQLLQAAPTELWTPGGWLLDVGYCGKPNALNHAQCHQWTVKTIIKVALWQWFHHACGEILVQYNQSHYRCTPGRPWSETDGAVRSLSLDLKFEKSPFRFGPKRPTGISSTETELLVVPDVVSIIHPIHWDDDPKLQVVLGCVGTSICRSLGCQAKLRLVRHLCACF